MNLPLHLPMPLHRTPRRTLLALVAAGVAAAACMALYGWLQGAASPRPPDRPAVQASTVTHGVALDGSPWEWPEHLETAAGMFQCWPAAHATLASVVVWTDKADQVVAYGAAMEGTPMPDYAAALQRPEGHGAGTSVYVAQAGHTVQTAATRNLLQLHDTTLACVRTWDD